MTEDIRRLQREEALTRLKTLNVSKNVLNDFKKGVINYSERQNKFFDGILYWVTNEQRFVDAIKSFEADTGALVYHAHLMHTEFGDWLTLLYVGKDSKRWSQDLTDLRKGNVYAYVETFDHCSEYGYVGIVPKNGGVSRTY